MTTPVEEDDLLQGATKHLLSIPEIVEKVGSNSLGPFIWQEAPPNINMENTQSVGIVVNTSAIGVDDPDHTRHFERLGIEFWVSPIRDASGDVIEPAETRRRLNAVYRVVDKYLHRPDSREEMWGTVRTHSCERYSELDRFPQGDGNGILIGQVFYVVSLD